MTDTIVQVRLISVECANCHVTFGVTAQYEIDRRDDHKSFWCPAGHSNYYPHKSDAEKLREQLATERRRLEAERARVDYWRAERDREKRKHSATKGQLTKTKRRAAAGVCPVSSCHRSFADVERHVRTQHPEFAESPS